MPADIVTPPAISHIGSGGGEARLECERSPHDEGVAGESDRVTMVAQSAPAGENERPLTPIPSKVMEVQVVEPPKRIEIRAPCSCALAASPIHQKSTPWLPGGGGELEIPFHEMRISHIEGDGLPGLRVDAHPARHVGILLLVRMNPLRRMQVEGGPQAPGHAASRTKPAGSGKSSRFQV